jgi:peptidoglycan/LPS O-acetylase OafA/YrhL
VKGEHGVRVGTTEASDEQHAGRTLEAAGWALGEVPGVRTPLRSDIQGLRCIAVSLVLCFHLWPSAVRGGYVGVDVFLVVSGYLITGHLLREVDRTGRLNVLAFWERRLRRLLPASLLVLVSCGLFTFALAPEFLWRQYFHELLASALYVQNWALASDSIDYFAANNAPSPVQHFWTLSLEEQFYASWPLVILSTLLLTRRASIRFRSWLLACAGLLCLFSVAYAVLMTREGSPTYFSTRARVWEFGVGAALSMLPVKVPGPLVRWSCAWLGVLGILVAGFWMHEPMVASCVTAEILLAVAGTLAVLWAGEADTLLGPGRVLGWRPLQFTGDISYSLYLWHWPLITLAPFALDRELDGLDKTGVVVASVMLAAGTTIWLERPIRFSPSHRRARFWVGNAAGTLIVVGISLLGKGLLTEREITSGAIIETIVAQAPPCFGAAAGPVLSPCENPDLAGLLVPDPEVAASDEGNRNECWATSGEVDVEMCHLGPRVGYKKRLAALGDSHNNALLPAYEVIAQRMQWRIDVAGKFGCYWTTAVQQQQTRARVRECEQWKAKLNERLAHDRPYDAIIVTHGVSRMQPAPTGEDQSAVIVRGLLEAWRSQTQRGTRIIAIRDNPIARMDTTACVAKYRFQATEHCALDRATALGHFDGNVRASQLLQGTYLIDLSNYYCTAEHCLTVVGHVPVYRDADHITATFARSLAPFLLLGMRDALGS